MTAITAPTTVTTEAPSSRSTSLWRTGARAGVLAALATTTIATVALAADVPLEIAGEQIPLVGFAQMTLLCTAVGVVLATALRRRASSPRHTFTVTAVVLTMLSFVPDVTADATSASKLVLIATHVVAAAIVIPDVADRLPKRSQQ